MPITPWEGWPHLLLHTKMFCNWWMLPPFGADLFDISFSYGSLISTWPSANSLRAYRVNTKKIDTLPCSKFDFNLLVKLRTFIGAREKTYIIVEQVETGSSCGCGFPRVLCGSSTMDGTAACGAKGVGFQGTTGMSMDKWVKNGYRNVKKNHNIRVI